ncbi:hypothetical protein OG302_35960 [Streptomyces sp. NBC_01283]|nr:hypothetical protein OG302_35960 [Streptomyces sp. NBC_01283]
MTTRAVLVAAVITGLLLGIVGSRTDDSDHAGHPRTGGSIAEAGR